MNRKEVERLIGKINMPSFDEFMKGQTVGFDRGIIDYYEDDVKRFIHNSKIKNAV